MHTVVVVHIGQRIYMDRTVFDYFGSVNMNRPLLHPMHDELPRTGTHFGRRLRHICCISVTTPSDL